MAELSASPAEHYDINFFGAKVFLHCLAGQKPFYAIDLGRSGSLNGYLLLFLPTVRCRGGEATAPVMRIAIPFAKDRADLTRGKKSGETVLRDCYTRRENFYTPYRDRGRLGRGAAHPRVRCALPCGHA